MYRVLANRDSLHGTRKWSMHVCNMCTLAGSANFMSVNSLKSVLAKRCDKIMIHINIHIF